MGVWVTGSFVLQGGCGGSGCDVGVMWVRGGCGVGAMCRYHVGLGWVDVRVPCGCDVVWGWVRCEGVQDQDAHPADHFASSHSNE